MSRRELIDLETVRGTPCPHGRKGGVGKEGANATMRQGKGDRDGSESKDERKGA